MSELFGIPTGLRAYQDDQIKLAELGMRQQSVAASTALANAQARNLDVDNARQAEELAMRKQEAARADALRAELARIAQGGSSGPDSPAGKSVLGGGSQFDTMLATSGQQVDYLIRTGNVKEATDLLTKLSGGVKDLAQARQAATAAAENEYDVAAKRHESVAKTLSGVTDQATYDAARLQLQSSGLLSPEDLAEMPARFNPLFIRSATAGTAAAKQKADLAREAARTAALNASTYDEMRNRKLVRDLEERKHTLAIEREKRLEKQGEARLAVSGNKSLGAPVPREIAAVTAELKRSGLNFSKDVSPALKNDLVAEVRDLVRSSAMSYGEATAKVVAEMKADGRISENTWSKDDYKPEGKTANRPMPLPATRDQLVPGNYYRDPVSGKVEQFKGFAK